MDSKDELFLPVLIVVVFAVIALFIWSGTENYGECIQMGHSPFYCVAN